jgi:protein-disulfide isomerase
MMRVMFAALAMLALIPAAHAAPAKKAAPAKVDWTRTVVATPEGGVRMGNPAAKVKLVEYGSRTCPHCAHFEAEGLPKLKADYIASGKVSYEFRDFPIHAALDLGPMLLGHCVPARAFFPVLEAMMANQQTLIGRQTQIPEDKQKELQGATPNAVATYLAGFYGYTDMVVAKGLPRAKAAACLADKKAVDAVVAQADYANKTYALQSTPTFILNGAAQANVFDWATLEPVLRAAVAK